VALPQQRRNRRSCLLTPIHVTSGTLGSSEPTTTIASSVPSLLFDPCQPGRSFFLYLSSCLYTTHAKPTSSTLSSVRSSSSCQSVKLDPGGRLASQTSQTGCLVQPCPTAAVAVGQALLNRALELLSPQERVTIEEHIIATTNSIISAVGRHSMPLRRSKSLREQEEDIHTSGFGPM
jgi:hypothetical protein